MLESASTPSSSDLYDFGARSYDPSLGAFTSFDSVSGGLQNPLTLNRYLYANADPATLVDPDGHTATLYDWDESIKESPKTDCSASPDPSHGACHSSTGWRTHRNAAAPRPPAVNKLQTLNENPFFHSIKFKQNPLATLQDEAWKACSRGGSDVFSYTQGCKLHYSNVLEGGGRGDMLALVAVLGGGPALVSAGWEVLSYLLPLGLRAGAQECEGNPAACEGDAQADASVVMQNLSSWQKGILGEEWSEINAIANGDEILAYGHDAELTFNIGGQSIRIWPDMLTRTADGTYKIIESKFSQYAPFTENQAQVYPELIKAGDNGIVATVTNGLGTIQGGGQIRVFIQIDVWNGDITNPEILGQ